MWRASARSLIVVAALGAAAAPLPAQTPAADTAVVSESTALAQDLKAQGRDSLGQLEYPEVAGPLVKPVTPADNTALVIDIERKIRCTCGCNLSVYTCRTTDFSCTVSPAMHRLVLARLDSGMTEAQVLASFEKQYGEMIFMTPPRRGFNWVAYITPFVGLLVGIGLVTALVRRWFRVAPAEAAGGAAPAGAPGSPPPPGGPDGTSAAAGAGAAGVTPEDLEKLKRELERFEA